MASEHEERTERRLVTRRLDVARPDDSLVMMACTRCCAEEPGAGRASTLPALTAVAAAAGIEVTIAPCVGMCHTQDVVIVHFRDDEQRWTTQRFGIGDTAGVAALSDWLVAR